MDNSVCEILRNLDFVQGLPEDNLLRGYLTRTLHAKFASRPAGGAAGGGASQTTYRLTYAAHLYLSRQYTEVIRVTRGLMVSTGLQPGEQLGPTRTAHPDLSDHLMHVFYLSAPLAYSLLGPPLVAGLKRTFRHKVPVTCAVFGRFLGVMAGVKAGLIGVNVGGTDREFGTKLKHGFKLREEGFKSEGFQVTAEEEKEFGVNDLRHCCDEVLEQARRLGSADWRSLSNDLTLTAQVLSALNRHSEALFALSHAAAIQALWGKREMSPILSITQLPDSLQDVLELSLCTHWSAVPLMDALPALSAHLYPGRPPPDALGLLLDLLLPRPRDADVVDHFLCRVEPWRGSGDQGDHVGDQGSPGDLGTVLSYMTLWQCALRVAYPRLGPEHRVRTYLQAKYPHLVHRDALHVVSGFDPGRS